MLSRKCVGRCHYLQVRLAHGNRQFLAILESPNMPIFVAARGGDALSRRQDFAEDRRTSKMEKNSEGLADLSQRI
jgi:hypothetical protein